MSNALAIAGVTAVLKDLLDSGLIEHQVTDTMGQGVTVSAAPPDTIAVTGDEAGPRLNLFMYQATPNAALRNAALPSVNGRGARIANPPLALDLHYLLTAYGTADLQAEVLLGYAMQLLHETPVLTRAAIRTALDPSPVDGTVLPAIYEALRAADLAEQLEMIKITPTLLNTEEMSRLWSALQARYRPTAAYLVSVVLIESMRAAHAPLPVLSRGPVDPVTQRDAGIIGSPSLIPPLPTLEAVVPPNAQPLAQLGDTIELRGHHLSGTGRTALLFNARFQIEREVAAAAGDDEASVQFVLPNTPADFPVGVYLASARLMRAGETVARTTNRLPLAIAPRITTALPLTVARSADGIARIDLDCAPQVRAGQRATLILGEREIVAEPFTAPTGTLRFRVADPPLNQALLARLRIDGIDSPIVDRSATPPRFFNHRITIT
jgi:hypothetical protein